MIRALITPLALLLASSSGATTNASPAAPAALVQPATAEAPFAFDAEAERQLLDLANQARAQAGVAPLLIDDGLTKAARDHSQAMVAQQQLSHLLPGEAFLTQRLAADSTLHLDHAGENVAYAGSVDRVQDVLMNSAPHRTNLLNPGYNVVGFGAVWSGSILYVTQDFGHSLPMLSSKTGADAVAARISRVRSQFNLADMERMDGDSAQASACSMAKADSLNQPSSGGRYIIRYTGMQPDTLPASAARAIADAGIHAFSVGTCYGRTATYPSGVYWVTLLFY